MIEEEYISFETAVADVIDNSISAHATTIRVLFPTTPLQETAVGILDDGSGMSLESLFEAMRYGSMASEVERDEDNLGNVYRRETLQTDKADRLIVERINK